MRLTINVDGDDDNYGLFEVLSDIVDEIDLRVDDGFCSGILTGHDGEEIGSWEL